MAAFLNKLNELFGKKNVEGSFENVSTVKNTCYKSGKTQNGDTLNEWQAYYDGNIYMASRCNVYQGDINESLYVIDKVIFEQLIDGENYREVIILINRGKTVYEYSGKYNTARRIFDVNLLNMFQWYYKNNPQDRAAFEKRVADCKFTTEDPYTKLEIINEQIDGQMTVRKKHTDLFSWQAYYDGNRYMAHKYYVASSTQEWEESCWLIDEEIFEKLGTFDNGYYSSSALINSGKCVYEYKDFCGTYCGYKYETLVRESFDWCWSEDEKKRKQYENRLEKCMSLEEDEEHKFTVVRLERKDWICVQKHRKGEVYTASVSDWPKGKDYEEKVWLIDKKIFEGGISYKEEIIGDLILNYYRESKSFDVKSVSVCNAKVREVAKWFLDYAKVEIGANGQLTGRTQSIPQKEEIIVSEPKENEGMPEEECVSVETKKEFLWKEIEVVKTKKGITDTANWQICYDGQNYTASIHSDFLNYVKESLWIIDEETFKSVNRLNNNDAQALDKIQNGKCVYQYECYSNVCCGYLYVENVTELFSWYWENSDEKKNSLEERLEKCITLKQNEEHKFMMDVDYNQTCPRYIFQKHRRGGVYTASLTRFAYFGSVAINEKVWVIDKESFEWEIGDSKRLVKVEMLYSYWKADSVTYMRTYDANIEELADWFFEYVRISGGPDKKLFYKAGKAEIHNAKERQFINIWKKALNVAQEEINKKEDLQGQLSNLEKDIATKKEELETSNSKADMNQLFILGGRSLTTEDELGRGKGLAEEIRKKEKLVQRFKAEIDGDIVQRIAYSLAMVRLEELYDGPGGKEAENYRTVLAQLVFISSLSELPEYAEIVDPEEKKLVDSYIKWADIQCRIGNLIENPATIYADGRYDINPDFRGLYEEICDGVNCYVTDNRAEVLKQFTAKTTYAEYLWILHKYNEEYYRSTTFYSWWNGRHEGSRITRNMEFENILWNQLLKECQEQGTDFADVLENVEKEFMSLLECTRWLWRDSEFLLHAVLWRDIKVSSEALEMIEDSGVDDLHDEKKYLAIFLNDQMDGWSNRVTLQRVAKYWFGVQ